MAATLIICPTATAVPFKYKDPSTGSVLIFTARKSLAELSSGSVKPKSAAWITTGVSSWVNMFLSAPSGASFTELTLKERVVLFSIVPSDIV
ncbi:hypothetical protein LEWO105114_11720 [Legionella worsleiensis]